MRILTILIIALIAISSNFPSYAQPVNAHGKLRVEGTQLVTSAGTPYRLRGMGYPRHNWWGHLWNQSTMQWLYDDWKCNSIRAAIGIEPERGYLEDPASAKQKIKEMVDAAIDMGIYVIIDWHAHDIYLDQARAFFIEMAQTYGEYPNVIYELINEPDYESWSEVKNYSIDIIANIRAIDPDNIILVGSPHWSQDVDVVADDPITGFENIMYTAHFYAGTHGSSYRSRWDYALGKGIPIVISECGAMMASGGYPINHGEWERWVEWMDNNNLSWFPWGLGSKEGFASSTLVPNASWTGGWSESDLTEWGRISRTLFRKYADPDPPPPTNISVNLFLNPAGTDILVLIENDPVTTPLFIRFNDATGKLILETSLESDVSHIPVSFPKGVYFVKIGRNDNILAERVLIL